MNKLAIENLNLFYGDFQALKNINMNIAAKEITALSDQVVAVNLLC